MDNNQLRTYMQVAFEEAKSSLKEGNNGFGAVILRQDKLIARAHDRENSDSDPTSHAELNAIKSAAQALGKDLEGCTLISTHEPCPMCSGAVVWSGISKVVYGRSIKKSLSEGRSRIDISCGEIFSRAGKSIKVMGGVLSETCGMLYDKRVRNQIKLLRGATDTDLDALRKALFRKRSAWFKENRPGVNPYVDPDIDPYGDTDADPVKTHLLHLAYRLLLQKLGIDQSEAPITRKTENSLTFHSKNFCPTLEACKLLDLDTRNICKRVNEEPTDSLLKLLDKRLCFQRNYDKIRPHSSYCEETISITEHTNNDFIGKA